MTSVERLQKGELAVGSTARVTQPKLKAAVYTVTECEPGKSFVWEMKATGVKVRAIHLVEDRGEGHARMTLGIEQTGALSGLIAMLYGKLTRQYVQMEAEGLKKAAEETPESETEKVSESKPESEAEETPETEKVSESETVAESKPESEAETASEPEPGATTGSKSQPESEPEAKAESEPEQESEPEKD
jgi:hypothetical protein